MFEELPEFTRRQICTAVSRSNNNKQQPTQKKDLCYDFLPVKYMELTHPLREFVVYRFLVIYPFHKLNRYTDEYIDIVLL